MLWCGLACNDDDPTPDPEQNKGASKGGGPHRGCFSSLRRSCCCTPRIYRFNPFSDAPSPATPTYWITLLLFPRLGVADGRLFCFCAHSPPIAHLSLFPLPPLANPIGKG